MSTIDLIILGILHEKAMNAYELARYIEDKQVYRLLKISQPAVYKNCKRLFKSGYLSGEKVRQGENPEKVIYKVSKKGKDYFYELMEHFSRQVQPFYFDFNTFIWNMNKLKPDKAFAMLQELHAGLLQWKEWIIQHEQEATLAPFHIRIIVKQYRMILVTLVEWVEEVLHDFKKGIK